MVELLVLVGYRGGFARGHPADLQVPRQTEIRQNRDRPFAGIPVVPPNAVAVIGGKAMMEVVIPFPICQKRHKPIVPRSGLSVVAGGAKFMRKRINAKRRVMHECQPHADRENKCREQPSLQRTDRHRK